MKLSSGVQREIYSISLLLYGCGVLGANSKWQIGFGTLLVVLSIFIFFKK